MDLSVLEYSEAVSYFRRIMTPDDVLTLKFWVQRFDKAPSNVREYLQRCCRTVPDLEYFFKQNPHYFFVENGRVALYEPHMEMISNMAEKYFKSVLEVYGDPIHFTGLKKKHLEDAPENIQEFFRRFYPSREFIKFFKARLDIFTLDTDHNVFLIEIVSVAYFKRRLEAFGRDNLRFMDFRGHIGQAPPNVQQYINRKYPGDEFQVFIMRNSDVFQLDENGFVSLVLTNS